MNPIIRSQGNKTKKAIEKKDDINFDDDLFGKMGDELEDDSSFDISIILFCTIFLPFCRFFQTLQMLRDTSEYLDFLS